MTVELNENLEKEPTDLKKETINPELFVLCVICVIFLLGSIGVVRTKISCQNPPSTILYNAAENSIPFLPVNCNADFSR